MLSRLYPSGTHPSLLTRPKVGLMPLIPQYDAGPRIEPPVSEPSPPSTSPPPTASPAQPAVPVPELDPPGVRAGSHGFRAIGKPVAGSGQPIANSCSTV